MNAGDNRPLYQIIKEDIKKKIDTSQLSPGDRLPTEQELTEQYQVSRITVSKALGELKEEGILVRYPNKGTFVAQNTGAFSMVKDAPAPSAVADLPPSIITEIACLIPSISDYFSISVINGITSVFPGDKYVIHLFQSFNPAMENYILQRCLDLKFAGILLFPQDQPFFSNQLLFMQLQKYPLVLLDRYLPRLDTCYVIADNREAGALCLNHLADLGHQKIALVSSSDRDTFSVKNRLIGAREAVQKRGMPDSSLVCLDHFDQIHPSDEYPAKIRRLVSEEHVTAFIVTESPTCIFLYDMLYSMGIRVPEDVSLVTFDRCMSDSLPPNFFTHIDQSEFLMGQQAGLLLKNRIEHADMSIYHRIIKSTLVVQKSSTPMKKDDNIA